MTNKIYRLAAHHFFSVLLALATRSSSNDQALAGSGYNNILANVCCFNIGSARAISGGMRKPCKERGQGTLLEVKVHLHCEHRQVTTITSNNKVVIIKTIFFLVGTLIQQYTHNTVLCVVSS